MNGQFSITTVAGWGDMDVNAHMENVAYLNKCVDSRMSFFSENGFPATEFARRRIGPVMRRDEIDYFREVALRTARDSGWSTRYCARNADGSISRRAS